MVYYNYHDKCRPFYRKLVPTSSNAKLLQIIALSSSVYISSRILHELFGLREKK